MDKRTASSSLVPSGFRKRGFSWIAKLLVAHSMPFILIDILFDRGPVYVSGLSLIESGEAIDISVWPAKTIGRDTG